MRNPYGSRGGYVTSRRDRADYEDMARGRDRARRMGYFDYNTQDYEGDMARGGRGGGRDRADYEDYAGRGRDRADYENYGYDMRYGGDYAGRGGDRADYDMRGGRDYADNDYKLTPTEIRKWDKELKNEGAPFSVDQVRQVAQQHGIRFDEFTPELLTAVANMMYTDYKDTVKGDISMFVKLAKDFLCDEDFDGEPEEKAYLYYTAIVNKDDD